MNWDRFDICRAYYWFAANYHGGQRSPEYAILGRLSRLQFKLSPLDYGPKRDNPDDENCRAILAGVLRRWRQTRTRAISWTKVSHERTRRREGPKP